MRFGFGSKTRRWFLLALLGLAAQAGVPTQGEAFQSGDSAGPSSADHQTLQTILDGMDQAAARFKSVVGNLEYTKVTVIVNDTSTETGKIYFEKTKGKPRVLLAFTAPAEKYVLLAEGKVSIYRPKIAEVEEYSLAKRQDLVEQFLLLGFGTGGEELQKSYQAVLLGEEKLDGQRAFHLELVPKSSQVVAQLKRIELWLSPETWQPLQQKFLEPSGDYLIARYSGLQQNVKIPAKNLRLPLRGNVHTVRH
ncbi:MAG: outer membrane lipoprotein carrier protein LolA [Acidobacteria bacterium]|nr:outer membrane lipoprotein carrier protein LolA [Acidobacteriota bacterium]